MKKIIVSIIICMALALTIYAQSQSVDLGIQNILQETPEWCWAAASQQVILWLKGPAQTPSQCYLVAVAKNVDPQACCAYPMNFAVPGSLYDVQNLILYFGGHASTIAAPTDPYTLFNTLSAGRAIIMFVRTSPYSNHFIVIRGMTFNPDPVIFINYPMNYYIQPFSYYSLLQSWSAAIVVY